MTISKIAEQLNLSTDTLRYYERIGIIPPVPRTANGIRVYNDNFLQRIYFIQKLKACGMSLEAIIDYIHLAQKGISTYQERKSILVETRTNLLKKMENLQEKVKLADYQLANYDKLLLPETDSLMQEWQDRHHQY